MTRRTLVSLILAALALVVVARADSPADKKDDLDLKTPKDNAALEQERLLREFRDFKHTLLTLKQRLEKSDRPEDRTKVEILEKALAQASKLQVDNQFAKLLDALRSDKELSIPELQKILQQNKELASSIGEILKIMNTGDRDAERKRLIEEYTRKLEQLKKVIREQQNARAFTERGMKDALSKQRDVTEDTRGLLKDSKNKGEGKPGDAKGDKSKSPLGKGEGKNDTKESKAGDKQDGDSSSKEGKSDEGKEQGKNSEGKSGEGKNAESKNSEGKPGEGKNAEGKPGEAKPGEGKEEGKNSEGKPGEAKPGEGKQGESKPGQGKQNEGKPGEAKPGEGKQGEGKPGEAKQGESKPGEGKPGEGKQGENKPGEGKPGEGKPGEGKQGEGKQGGQQGKPGEGKQGGQQGKPGEGKQGEGKQGGQQGQQSDKSGGKESGKESGNESKPGENKAAPKNAGENKPGDGKGEPRKATEQKPASVRSLEKSDPKGKSDGKGEGKPSQSQSKSQQSSGQQGQQSQSKSQGGQQQGQQGGSKGDGQQQQQQQQGNKPQGDQDQFRKKIKDAEEYQQKAEDEIQRGKRDEGSKDQGEALKNLEEARKKLEDLLRQLRQEEIERTLAALQARCQRMLDLQIAVKNGTVSASRDLADGADQRAVQQRSNTLSDDEDKIVVEANKAIALLEEEGSAVAFPEIFKEVRRDMLNVSARLRKTEVGVVTQAIEQDIIDTLGEMIKAFKKARQENQQDKQQQQQQNGGKPADPKLIDLLGELKLIRSMQVRINNRTQTYGQEYPGEQVLPEKAKDQSEREKFETIQRELRELSESQIKLFKITNDLAKGRNK